MRKSEAHQLEINKKTNNRSKREERKIRLLDEERQRRVVLGERRLVEGGKMEKGEEEEVIVAEEELAMASINGVSFVTNSSSFWLCLLIMNVISFVVKLKPQISGLTH